LKISKQFPYSRSSNCPDNCATSPGFTPSIRIHCQRNSTDLLRLITVTNIFPVIKLGINSEAHPISQSQPSFTDQSADSSNPPLLPPPPSNLPNHGWIGRGLPVFTGRLGLGHQATRASVRSRARVPASHHVARGAGGSGTGSGSRRAFRAGVLAARDREVGFDRLAI
jgi:hypothetical protein